MEMIYLNDPNWKVASEPKVGRATQRKPYLKITQDRPSDAARLPSEKKFTKSLDRC